MRYLIYQVAVGETKPLYEKCIASVAAYCRRYGYEHYVQREPILRIVPKASRRSVNALRLGYLPIYEKMNGYASIWRYDGVAVIDADVYIRPVAASIFAGLDFGAAFLACPERLMPVTAAYARKLDKYEHAQYGPLYGVGLPFLQMGVVRLEKSFQHWFPEEPREFLNRVEFQSFINGEGAWKWSTEQTMMNWWLRKQGVPISYLNWHYNALYGVLQPKMLRQASFIHFFLSEHLRSQDPEELLAQDYQRPRV